MPIEAIGTKFKTHLKVYADTRMVADLAQIALIGASQSGELKPS